MTNNLNIKEQAEKTLRLAGLVRGMSEDEIQVLAAISEQKEFPKTAAIIQEDSKSRDLYVICCGRISVRLTLPAMVSKEEIVYTMRDGQIFGELALVDGSPRSATVRAEDDVTVLRFDFTKLSELLDNSPRIGYLLMRNIAAIIAARVRNTNMLWRNSLIW